MKQNRPTSDQWERLLDLSEKIWRIKPWETISEGDVLGVKIPGDGPTVFVSAMGSLGEHRAIVVYLGVRALFDLTELQESGPRFSPFELLEIPHCNVSFEPRRDLETVDLAALRKTTRKFERDGYPVFRYVVPGFVPEPIDADHAAILITALEQFLEAFPHPTGGGEDEFLVRERDASGWTDVWQELKLPKLDCFEAEIPAGTTEKILALPLKSRQTVQMDAFPLPTIAYENGVGFLPRTLLAINKAGDGVVGSTLFDRALTAKGDFDLLVVNFVELLLNIGFRPGKIVYFSEEFENLAAELGEEFGIRFEVGSDYGAFSDFRQALAEAVDDSESFGFDFG